MQNPRHKMQVALLAEPKTPPRVECVYWRAGASLPSRPNGAIFLYIYYLYPALMYAVMFYVILNKRKLHFPLAKNVMHSPSIIL